MTNAETAAPGDSSDGEAARPKRRILRRVFLGMAIAVLSLIGLAALSYFFGGMQPPTAETRAAYARLVASGSAPAVEARFHIPIPGCVCHSDDPVLQAQHEYLYIRDCRGCHAG